MRWLLLIVLVLTGCKDQGPQMPSNLKNLLLNMQGQAGTKPRIPTTQIPPIQDTGLPPIPKVTPWSAPLVNNGRGASVNPLTFKRRTLLGGT